MVKFTDNKFKIWIIKMISYNKACLINTIKSINWIAKLNKLIKIILMCNKIWANYKLRIKNFNKI